MENQIPNIPPKSERSNLTTRYFNNYFKPDLSVSQNVDNSVLAYFESITGNKDTAKTLASSVLYTALTQGIDPMDIVTEMNNLSKKNESQLPQSSNYSQRTSANNDPNALPGPNLRPKSTVEINSYLALFLNLSRVNTSLLGISNEPPVNKYIQRSILP